MEEGVERERERKLFFFVVVVVDQEDGTRIDNQIERAASHTRVLKIEFRQAQLFMILKRARAFFGCCAMRPMWEFFFFIFTMTRWRLFYDLNSLAITTYCVYIFLILSLSRNITQLFSVFFFIFFSFYLLHFYDLNNRKLIAQNMRKKNLYSPLSRVDPKTLERSSLVVQFQRSLRNWYWHCWIPWKKTNTKKRGVSNNKEKKRWNLR